MMSDGLPTAVSEEEERELLAEVAGIDLDDVNRMMRMEYLPSPGPVTVSRRRKEQVELLYEQTASNSIDVARDYDWAWMNMGRIRLMPRAAPSVPAYQLYLLAREDNKTFLARYADQQKQQRAIAESRAAALAAREDDLEALDKLAAAVEADIPSLIEDTLKHHRSALEMALRKRGWMLTRIVKDVVIPVAEIGSIEPAHSA